MLWKKSDIRDGIEYKLCLGQTPEGRRFFSLTEVSRECPENSFLVTRPVPCDLLKRRDLIAIAESVLLDSGDKFCVDAHGVWFSASEMRQRADRSTDFHSIEWITPIPPILPPA